MLSVAAVQYCAKDDAAATLAHIRPMIAKEAERARLVTLPEAATYLAASRSQLAERAEWEDDRFSYHELASIAREFSIWLLAGSLMMRRRDNGRMVNRSLLIGLDGALVAKYDKIQMFDANVGDGQVYRESQNFAAGELPVIAKIESMATGLSICYYLRFPHLYRQLAIDGAKLLLVPAAFTATSGRAH